jgi:hypothetical protein
MSTVYPSATPGTLPPSHTSTVERTVVSGIDTGRDRVRWGPIVAGIFATITSLVVLSLLGAAIGASAVDQNDRPSSFAIGAGIWGIVSALIAFFIGGWMAAWGGRETGEHNGVTQGVMVWMVAIPLSLYLAAVGAGAATRAIGSAAQIGTQAAGAAAQAAAQDPQARDSAKSAASSAMGGSTTQPVGTELKEKATELSNSVTGDKVEKAAENTAKAAWGTLAAVMLGLAAAALGGFVGGDHHKDHFGAGRRGHADRH